MQKDKGKAAIDIIELGMIFFLFFVYLMKTDAHLLRNKGLICNFNRNVQERAIFVTSSQFSKEFA